MKAKKIKEQSAEVALLKKLRDKALVVEERKKRQTWVEKLVAMSEPIRDVHPQELPETPYLFQAIAEKIVEEGV
ncbi:hypothetical protein [Candidatus Chlamydia sanziniae]|uniref:Uncharacterized protein n=1 Tax=Candidatus Chlamydia sanziniae TaxID=1806891 RepID=A0A1A9HXC9_9CHLA|nr:hypothetical protein [Candidatus Chlamydia sanziniae]ANH78694.1 hypothetical protein Cs308_0524 [Candidatus Chlamydia sanziniae]